MHISFVMDGNGRWAKKRGLPRKVGHKAGADNLREIVRALGELGVDEATFYAFSTENWNRPITEVKFLMTLVDDYLKSEIAEIHSQGARFKMIGFRENLAPKTLELIDYAEALTAENKGLKFNVAFNYGSRAELINAVKTIVKEANSGKIEEQDIDEDLISSKLLLSSEPDLLIRTGGEQRLSNYLLWQHSYSEFMFLPVLWPDFNKKMLEEAIAEYDSRTRRFGGLEE